MYPRDKGIREIITDIFLETAFLVVFMVFYRFGFKE